MSFLMTAIDIQFYFFVYSLNLALFLAFLYGLNSSSLYFHEDIWDPNRALEGPKNKHDTSIVSKVSQEPIICVSQGGFLPSISINPCYMADSCCNYCVLFSSEKL